MSKIQLFPHLGEILSFEIVEKEGEIPSATVTILPEHDPKNTKRCELRDGDKVLFSGVVKSFEKDGDLINFHLTQDVSLPIFQSSLDPDLVNLLYDNENLEIPEIFGKLKVPYYPRNGSSPTMISIFSEIIPPIPLDLFVFKDSLTVAKNLNSTIARVDLELSCSWVARVEGLVDISSKIAKKFQGGQINTLTPRSLEAAWPVLGTRMPGVMGARKSKYYVGLSRLSPENTMHMPRNNLYTPPIKVDGEKTARLRRHWYNHKFAIAFDYEQFHRETVKVAVVNKRLAEGSTKRIKINLKSVQEHLENDYQTSFFRVSLGQRAYRHIAEKAALYLAANLRDITMKFSMPYNPELNCATWVRVQGQIAKITSLKINNNKEMEIETMGFSDENFRQFLKTEAPLLELKALPIEEKPPIEAADVIHDIVVENDGYTQTKKLMEFTVNNAAHNKNLINNFLNKNKTTITIIAKPLKTQYCEEQIIDAGETFFH